MPAFAEPAGPVPWALGLPSSAAEIERIQRERKRLAVERARRSALLGPRLSGVKLDRLDDPEEWRKIPILTKDELRKLPTEKFYSEFCIAPIAASVEFWRSGGSTGKPLFYPRSAEDMKYMLGVAFRRAWPVIGARPGDVFHCSYPLGIHPVAQLYCRSAAMEGLSSVWAGAGTTTPSPLQIELIKELKPTIFGAMPSYALHLANIAEQMGVDLASLGVRKVICSAEPLTDAKRRKLERAWGARVYNSYGMTEGALTCVERDGHASGEMVAWTDLFFLEVVDSASGKPVAEGETGVLVMTPLWSNTITPFIRWMTGDVVTLRRQAPTDDPYSVFPLMRHALRTEGFFKVRGVNVNHGDLEDFLFARPEITDFRAEAVATSGNDALRLLVEIKRGTPAETVTRDLAGTFKAKFEFTPEIEVLETGTLAREFEKAVKAPRFVDKR
jgi:phenylacetate-CoA ligase